jgi:prepilin-type N-terminal cleavage/methylation domain-containing protein/prepilin-type processing-associated H-X9-DG protein
VIPSARRAFTLLEVVVAIAILGMLAGLLLVAIAHARLAAARVRCQDHLRQQGLAVLNFEAARGVLPPAAAAGPNVLFGVPNGVGHGLWPFVLGQLGEGALAARYRWDVSFDHPDNQAALLSLIPVLQCPASAGGSAGADYGPIEVNATLSDLGLPTGARPVGSLSAVCPARLSDIADGTSTTLLLTEGAGGCPWASPATTVPGRLVVTGGATHPGGLNACMADGSVRLLRTGTGPGVVVRLLTRAGGEPVPGDF